MTEPAPVHEGRRLDWVRRLDPRSLDYPMAAGPDAGLPERGRLWPHGRVLDQGREGACVGAGCVAEAAAEPVPVPGLSMRNALAWYRNAQRRDQWQGEAYEGTSVLAGCLEGRARGLYTGFRWAKRAEQVLAGVAEDGPAILGVEWREGAYGTDADGVLRPWGQVVGGHCICLIGAVVPADLAAQDDAGRELRADLAELGLLTAVQRVLEDEDAAGIIQNSWGLSFGRYGLCVVPLSVLRAWAAAGWEAAQPQGRKLPTRKGITVPTLGEAATETEAAVPMTEQDAGDTTLHLPATEVQDGDRLLDPPDEMGQESVTVRGRPQVIADHRGRRVMVNSTAGTFTLPAGATVTVRREQ